jgi:hypothetical protein
MNKDAYYFPHFANARHDRKLRRVRKELGIEGYAIYFMTLEVLREQEDFAYPLSDLDLLADDFGTSEAKVEAIVTAYNLFDVDADKFFYSPKLIEYLTPYLERSRRARKAALKRWNGDSDANALPEHSKCNASKVKKSKVKKSKEELSPLISDFTNIQKMQEPLTQEQGQKLINEFGKMKVQETLMAMENWKPLVNKNKSAYLTASTWIRRDMKNEPETKIMDGGTW